MLYCDPKFRLPGGRRTAVAILSSLAAALSFTTATSFAQDANLAGATPGYSRAAGVDLSSVPTLSSSPLLQYPGAGVDLFQASTDLNGSTANAPNNVGFNPQASQTLSGIQSVPLFTGAFAATGGPHKGTIYPYIMIGNSPLTGGTTTIPAKITTVDVQLLNADGSVFKTVPYGPFEKLTLNSPNFEPYMYPDGLAQFADAEQRAQFWNTMKQNWHTNLAPAVVNRVTIAVPYLVNVRLSNGNIIQARSYFTGTASDGSTFVLMLDLLFNFFFQNQVVSDLNAGNDSVDAFNYQVWPNTFLFSLNVNSPNVPGGCCILGFHTYFFANAVPQPRAITAFASWISPGIFGGGFEDATGLSHETSEAFNDPFVNTAVPVWQFPGVPANAKVCQSNLETGDPIEVLASASIPISIKETGKVFTYHPQNEALMQWFNQGATSDAFNGAYSFPNASVLPHSAVPCPP